MKHQPVRQDQTTTLRTTCTCRTLFDKFVGSLTFFVNHVTLKMQETAYDLCSTLALYCLVFSVLFKARFIIEIELRIHFSR